MYLSPIFSQIIVRKNMMILKVAGYGHGVSVFKIKIPAGRITNQVQYALVHRVILLMNDQQVFFSTNYRLNLVDYANDASEIAGCRFLQRLRIFKRICLSSARVASREYCKPIPRPDEAHLFFADLGKIVMRKLHRKGDQWQNHILIRYPRRVDKKA